MRRNSRLYYAYLNCSMLTWGQIIDVFCLDVTKCGEWLYNETNMKNCSITTRSAQMFGLTWSLERDQLRVKRTDGLTQTWNLTAGRVTEINNKMRNKLKKRTSRLTVTHHGWLVIKKAHFEFWSLQWQEKWLPLTAHSLYIFLFNMSNTASVRMSANTSMHHTQMFL